MFIYIRAYIFSTSEHISSTLSKTVTVKNAQPVSAILIFMHVLVPEVEYFLHLCVKTNCLHY